MNIKRIALLASAAGALALGACSGGSDEPAAPTGNVENMTPIEVGNESPVAIETPTPTLVDNATATTAVEPTPTLSADEQTQDDADATGMTARVSRDEGANEVQPAQ